MRNALFVVAAAVTLASQVSGQVPAAGPTKIELAFEGNGIVTLNATNASMRDILNEWTRKGGTVFSGAERLTGNVTVQYNHKPEQEVITSLLRSASGIVVSNRQTPSQAASGIDVVYVLAQSTGTSGGSYTSPQSYSPPPQQQSTQGNPDTEIPPVGPGRSGQAGPPAQTEAPPPAPRPAGVSGVAVPVVTVPVTTSTGPGRGGGGGR